jgi:hypothetical protein
MPEGDTYEALQVAPSSLSRLRPLTEMKAKAHCTGASFETPGIAVNAYVDTQDVSLGRTSSRLAKPFDERPEVAHG